MKRPGDQGAEAVEFALVVPIFLGIIFGIVQFGYLFYVQAGLSGAAREGAREMAVTNDVSKATAAITRAAPVQLPTSAISIQPGTCTSGENATVVINFNLPSPTGMFPTMPIKAQGVMRCGG